MASITVISGLSLDKYRITAVVKVETDIFASITVSLIGRALILVIISVETFKADIILCINNIIMYLTSD